LTPVLVLAGEFRNASRSTTADKHMIRLACTFLQSNPGQTHTMVLMMLLRLQQDGLPRTLPGLFQSQQFHHSSSSDAALC
jgi:hypothetical protein